MSPQRRHDPAPTHVVAGDDQVLEVGGHCGLYIDLQLDDSAPMRGDWVATPAGSRYLVDDVQLVRSRKHAQRRRYQMTVLRLLKHATPPKDAHVIWLAWYPRARRT